MTIVKADTTEKTPQQTTRALSLKAFRVMIDIETKKVVRAICKTRKNVEAGSIDSGLKQK